MEVRELEKAIRAAMRMDSAGAARPVLAGAGDTGIQLPQEFATALQTLSERTEKRPDNESILQRAFQFAWT